MAATDKLLRWLDVIAALLRRHSACTFDELARDVPGYARGDAKAESIARTFERDKDELRALGIPIETLLEGDEEKARYRLKAEAFYLPYLLLCERALPSAVELRNIPRPEGLGFGRLPVVTMTPDDRVLLQRAAARARALGHAALAADADSAIRKLEHDLGPLVLDAPVVTTTRVSSDLFDVIGAAMQDRKRLTFTYHSMERDSTEVRTVEPYGQVFLTGHWYLVARDVRSDAMRQFRLSRMTDATMATAKANTPDYELPASFNLTAYSSSRRAWELGNGDATTVHVLFRGTTGQVAQGMQLGRALDDGTADVESSAVTGPAANNNVRAFDVRRMDRFLRWLLAFAGDAVPVAPPDVVSAWRLLVADTHAAHSAASVPGNAPALTHEARS